MSVSTTTPCLIRSQNSSARRASTANSTITEIASAVMTKIRSCGFWAQNEISNAGMFGSSGARAAAPG